MYSASTFGRLADMACAVWLLTFNRRYVNKAGLEPATE